MMTPDKDFAQLVSQNIFMYRPGRGGNPAQKWGVNEVCERFEVDDPIKVIDILGLWGDSVDNIPGIPGIGEKTSKNLIKQYGSVENLIANAHELKGKQQENVINFAEQGLLSKNLATIILDAPVELDEQDLKVEAPDEEKILSLFSELEFRALSKRVLGENAKIEIPAPTAGTQMDLFNSHSEENNETGKELKSIENVNANYTLIVTEEERLKLISILKDSKTICFDTETTGINAHQAELVGLCFSVKKGEGFYVPISEEQETAKKELLEFLPVFHDESIEKVAQNIKYDLTILKRYGIEVKGPLFDTMIAHYLFPGHEAWYGSSGRKLFELQNSTLKV